MKNNCGVQAVFVEMLGIAKAYPCKMTTIAGRGDATLFTNFLRVASRNSSHAALERRPD